ncbi:unnamed protein product [Sphenostylis stenocarpa]|uniref:Uncharacterized protein n=1 Tax=Sphenostylis stenocarpa TaxID=92480 RepID=A0AA86RW77_9FABA|nr:unnamed protein product [Sphenostylis stenocarpa]
MRKKEQRYGVRERWEEDSIWGRKWGENERSNTTDHKEKKLICRDEEGGGARYIPFV